VTDPQRRRLGDVGWGLLIGGIGLLIRLAYARQYAASPIGRMPWVDEAAYWARAREILGGRLLPAEPFYQDPLLAYLLAGLMRVIGTTDVGTLRVAPACVGALTPVAVYGAGRIGLGKAEGVIAGLIAALYGPLVFTDALLEKEGPAALAAAAALGLSIRALRPGRGWPWAVAAGLAWGSLALLRGNALILGPLAAGLMASGVGGLPRAGRRLRAAALLAGFGAAIAPATLANAAAGRPRELILTTWQAGANFYIGNGPEATGTYRAPPFVEANPAREAADFRAEAGRRAGRPLGCSASSRFWFRAGLRRWREAPGASLRLLGHKLGLLLHRSEIPDNQDAEVVRVIAAPALGWGVLGFGLLIPWSAAGLGLERSARGPAWWLIAATTAVGLGSTAAFFVVGRYRIPWVPGLALLAGAGAVDLARRARDRRWRGLAVRVALLMAPAAALAWRPMPDPAPDRWGHAQIGLASAYLETGELEPAIDALDDASALGPGPAARVAALRAGSPIRAGLAARIGRASAGERSPVRRARWLRQFPEGRGQALELLRLERYLHPEDPAPMRETGAWCLGQETDPQARSRAEGWFDRAARSAAGDPSAALLLALLTRDALRLPPGADPADGPAAVRLRLARAILAARPAGE